MDIRKMHTMYSAGTKINAWWVKTASGYNEWEGRNPAGLHFRAYICIYNRKISKEIQFNRE
jgi:hypothetical protein